MSAATRRCGGASGAAARKISRQRKANAWGGKWAVTLREHAPRCLPLSSKNTDEGFTKWTSSNYVLHSADSTLHGPAGYRQIYTTNVTAFPDCHFTIEDIVTEGDKVVTRFTFRGTHQGDWRGIAPTGKQVTVQGIAILRTASGKVVEEWAVWYTLSRMQQLGVVPMSG